MKREDFLNIAEKLYDYALDSSDDSDWYGINLEHSFDDYMKEASELFDNALKGENDEMQSYR